MLATDTKEDQMLRQLLSKLEERENKLRTLDEYYNGEQPLAFLPKEVKDALKNRIDSLNVNIPRLVVNSISERMRIIGIQRDGVPDAQAWDYWNRNDMDEQSASVHREALALGKAFVIVWADDAGIPVLSVESPRQMFAIEDPGTHEVLAAVKRWKRPNIERPELETDVAMLYLPDQIIRYESNPGTAPMSGAWDRTGTLDNPLGVVPVVVFKNSDRMIDEHGVSEMRDVLSATDGLTKILSDMMVSSEYYARPRRWATGVDLEEAEDAAGDPIGEADTPFQVDTDRPWTTENDAARFGSFDASDLGAYETAVRVLLGQIMAVSTLPAHYVGILSNAPVSADSIRASEASLTARAHARMRTFGRSWERVYRMTYDVAGKSIPAAEQIGPIWSDPATRTIAQEADAASKIFDSLGSVPIPLLERLGFDPNSLRNLNTARKEPSA